MVRTGRSARPSQAPTAPSRPREERRQADELVARRRRFARGIVLSGVFRSLPTPTTGFGGFAHDFHTRPTRAGGLLRMRWAAGAWPLELRLRRPARAPRMRVPVASRGLRARPWSCRVPWLSAALAAVQHRMGLSEYQPAPAKATSRYPQLTTKPTPYSTADVPSSACKRRSGHMKRSQNATAQSAHFGPWRSPPQDLPKLSRGVTTWCSMPQSAMSTPARRTGCPARHRSSERPARRSSQRVHACNTQAQLRMTLAYKEADKISYSLGADTSAALHASLLQRSATVTRTPRSRSLA